MRLKAHLKSVLREMPLPVDSFRLSFFWNWASPVASGLLASLSSRNCVHQKGERGKQGSEGR